MIHSIILCVGLSGFLFVVNVLLVLVEILAALSPCVCGYSSVRVCVKRPPMAPNVGVAVTVDSVG